METPLDPTIPVSVYCDPFTYLIDAGDEAAFYRLSKHKAEGKLLDVVGGFAAIMYLLIEGRPRHDTEIFAHANGNVLDFTRSNLSPTTRRKHSVDQLALGRATTGRIAGRRGPRRGVVKNMERFRVYFPAHGVMVSLGYYHNKAVALQIYGAYCDGTLKIAQVHAREVKQDKRQLSRIRKEVLLRELGLTDPPPAPEKTDESIHMHPRAPHTET